MNDPITYGTETPEDLHALWPDPTDAPHVPPPEILAKYMADPQMFATEEPTLARQIEDCPLIQKAIKQRKEAEAMEIPPMPEVPPVETVPAEDQPSDTQPHFGEIPSAGDLCSTSSTLPYWEGQRSLERISFSPSEILLLEKIEPVDGETEMWRVAPVVPEFICPEDLVDHPTCPFTTSDGIEYVALLEFIRPIMPIQIQQVLTKGCVQGETLEDLANYIHPVSLMDLLQSEDPDSFWNQQQAWATQLDAERECEEDIEDFFRKEAALLQQSIQKKKILQFAHQTEPELMAAASAGSIQHQMLLLSTTPSSIYCELEDVHADNDKLQAQWNLLSPPEELQTGTPFFLLQKSTNRNCGYGLLQSAPNGLSAELSGGDPTIVQHLEEKPEDFLLLCPYLTF